MKPFKMYTIGAVILFALLTTAIITHSAPSNKPIISKGFAVLELFTSEGCSSCPPAEALLASIQEGVGDKPIYVLSYHVDYWDHLGWKDAFSKEQFSKRQYLYNQLFTSQVYTPQLIVNGQAEYIGSDESAISKGLNEALAGTAAASINLAGQLANGKAKLTYSVSGKILNSQLLIAVVQKHAESKVARGENQGKTLPHVQIVRDLYEFNVAADKTFSQEITLPKEFNVQDWEIIAFVQNKKNGAIDAATHAVLTNANAQ